MGVLIRLRGVSFAYSQEGVSGHKKQVLTDVSLELLGGRVYLLCGATGSGKSTLLRVISGLSPRYTGGTLQGWLELGGEVARQIGYVNQRSELGFVAQTVADEIAFALEQLGVSNAEMPALIRSAAQKVGIEDLLHRSVGSLSGGQQQRLSIAAAIVHSPQILLLDEPTSELDDESATQAIALIAALAREHGMTVVIAEHRLERLLDVVDGVLLIDESGRVGQLTPKTARNELGAAGLTTQGTRPITGTPSFGEVVLEVDDLAIAFGENQVFAGLTFSAAAGEVVALVGKNGSGKSSTLWAIAGELKPSWGSIRVGDVRLVPQNSSDLLYLETVADELAVADASLFASMAGEVDLGLNQRDLSIGQQLALAISVQLRSDANVLLLDEPTRGLDQVAKSHLASTIRNLAATGKAIVIASHDKDFIRMTANRVVVLDGN